MKVTKQRLFNQALIIWVNGCLTECRICVLECNQERIVARNAGTNDQNIGSDNNNLVNVFLNNVVLSFEKIVQKSEEKKEIIEDIIEKNEHKLDEEVNGFK